LFIAITLTAVSLVFFGLYKAYSRGTAISTSGTSNYAKPPTFATNVAQAPRTDPESAVTSDSEIATAPEKDASARKWDMAISRSRNEPLQAVVHRAAISGKLSDILVAVIAQKRCLSFSASPSQLASMGIMLSPEKANRLQELHDDCWQAQVRKASGVEIKDDEGFKSSSSIVVGLVATGKITGLRDENRVAALTAIRETGSAELVLAVLESFTPLDLADAGFPLEDKRAMTADRAMLQLALRIIACKRGAYCKDAAKEDFECSLTRLCVTSLEDMPEKLIFGPEGTRSSLFANPDRGATDAAKARWQKMEKVASALLKYP